MNMRDVIVFGVFSHSTGESILNSVEAVYLGDLYVHGKRVAVVITVVIALIVTV